MKTIPWLLAVLMWMACTTGGAQGLSAAQSTTKLARAAGGVALADEDFGGGQGGDFERVFEFGTYEFTGGVVIGDAGEDDGVLGVGIADAEGGGEVDGVGVVAGEDV